MTLDEAIEHANERGQIRDACGLEHLQLAGWLSELNQTRKRNAELGRENAKLRELLVGAFEDMNAWQMVIAGSNEWGYGKGCLDSLCKLRDAMRELGMEVVV